MEKYRIDFFGITEQELLDQINKEIFDQIVLNKFQANLLKFVIGDKIKNWSHNLKDSSNKNLPHLISELKIVMTTLKENFGY